MLGSDLPQGSKVCLSGGRRRNGEVYTPKYHLIKNMLEMNSQERYQLEQERLQRQQVKKRPFSNDLAGEEEVKSKSLKRSIVDSEPPTPDTSSISKPQSVVHILDSSTDDEHTSSQEEEGIQSPSRSENPSEPCSSSSTLPGKLHDLF
jgi:hypothetical protein